MPNRRKPKLFIGTAKESLDIADLLHYALSGDDVCEPTVWRDGVFRLSREALADLVDAAKDFDFAAFVFAPNDTTVKRGSRVKSVRDNVLFETGLFMGSLGRDKTFLVQCKDDKVDVPTDLWGIKRALYPRRDDGNMEAAMRVAAFQLSKAIREADVVRDHTEACEDFVRAMAGRCPGVVRDADVFMLQQDKALIPAQYRRIVTDLGLV